MALSRQRRQTPKARCAGSLASWPGLDPLPADTPVALPGRQGPRALVGDASFDSTGDPARRISSSKGGKGARPRQGSGRLIASNQTSRRRYSVVARKVSPHHTAIVAGGLVRARVKDARRELTQSPMIHGRHQMRARNVGRLIFMLAVAAMVSVFAAACGGAGGGTSTGNLDASFDGTTGFGQLGNNDGAVANSCVPKTCQSLGYTCGSNSDGCGNLISCGSCTAPDSCGVGGFSKCGNP